MSEVQTVPQTIEQLRQVVAEQYDAFYETNHKLLHPYNDSYANSVDDVDLGFAEKRQQLAEATTAAYHAAESATDHRIFIEKLVLTSAWTSKPVSLTKEFLAHGLSGFAYAQNIEIFGQDMDQPSPAESLLSSAKNLELAERYAHAAVDHAVGVLVSGSTAWGTHYSTRGVHPEHKVESPSDVDLLVEVSSLDEMWHTVERYVEAGLVPEQELLRMRHFAIMSMDIGDLSAQMFSMRSFTTGTEVSIHMILSKDMDNITSLHWPDHLTRDTQGVPVPYIRDFRPNTTKNGGKGKGYLIQDIGGQHDLHFHPTNQLVEGTFKGEKLGYISESPLGAAFTIDGRSTYAIGLMPYFLAASPIVVGTHKTRMQERIEAMQNAIAEKTEHGATTIHRMERMTRNTIDSILGRLTIEVDEPTKTTT